MPDLVLKPLKTLLRSANPPVANIGDLKKDYYQFVVYGPGGVGKTHFGLDGAPTPIEWIDTDIRANTISFKFVDGRISTIYQPTTREEIENSIAWAIYNLQEHYKKTGKKGTILLDSYTSTKNRVIADYLSKQGRPVDAQMTIDDRSNVKRTMQTIIDNLKFSKLNLVVTAEQGIKIIGEESEDGKKQKITAVLGGVPKHEDDLMYFCDYLLWLFPSDEKRDGTNIYVTKYYWKLYKSSTSRIPQEMSLSIAPKEDITWAKIIPEIEGLQRAELKRMRGELNAPAPIAVVK